MDVFWDWEGVVPTGGVSSEGSRCSHGTTGKATRSSRSESAAVKQLLENPSMHYGRLPQASRGRLVVLDVSPWWEGVTETPCTSYEELLALERASKPGFPAKGAWNSNARPLCLPVVRLTG